MMYYLKNKVGVVDFTKACPLVCFMPGIAGFETLPIGRLL
jgi:hypothetical protein